MLCIWTHMNCWLLLKQKHRKFTSYCFWFCKCMLFHGFSSPLCFTKQVTDACGRLENIGFELDNLQRLVWGLVIICVKVILHLIFFSHVGKFDLWFMLIMFPFCRMRRWMQLRTSRCALVFVIFLNEIIWMHHGNSRFSIFWEY